MNPLAACRAYLAKLPSAVSGQGGHAATFRAACAAVRFGLSRADALALLQEWNGSHCSPPWTERELGHKIGDAFRLAGGSRIETRPRPAVRVVWKLERPAKPAARPVPVSPPEPEPAGLPSVVDITEAVRRPFLRETLPSTPDILHRWPFGVRREQRPERGGNAQSWLHVARQVLAGEFGGADRSTRESLTTGLRSIGHPLCHRALAQLTHE